MARHRTWTTDGVACGHIAAAFACCALAASAPRLAAAEQEPGVTGVKIIRDVSYGKHGVRYLMDFHLPEGGPP